MKRILLTGMSGTGKSTLIAALRERGYRGIDVDEPGWNERNADGAQLWNESWIARELAREEGAALFIAGCAENQVRFYPQLDHIVLLSAPKSILVERLGQRTNNPYGKEPEELAEVLEYVDTVEPLLRRRATCEIDTSVPFDDVLAQVLDLIGEDA